MLAAAIITIISSSLTFKKDQMPANSLDQVSFEHSRLGMTLSSIVISEVIFGFLTSYFKIFTKNMHAITLITRAHKIIGYSLFISGLVNCILGWIVHNNEPSMTLFAIAIIVISIILLVLETYQICCKNKSRKINQKLPEMTHFDALEQIKTGKEYVFAENLVVDISQFKKAHPGGCFLLQETIGEDSGKYMIGCSSYGGNYNPYTHSAKAMSYLKGLPIGRIPSPSGFIITENSPNQDFMDFVVFDKKPLNESTFLFYFKSDYFKLASQCNEPSWLGKHFKVFLNSRFSTTSRYYSALFIDLDQ